MGGRGSSSGFSVNTSKSGRESALNSIVESIKSGMLKKALVGTPEDKIADRLTKLRQSDYFVDSIKYEIAHIAMFDQNGFEYTNKEEKKMLDKIFDTSSPTGKTIPEGMEKSVYEKYVQDGFSSEQINQIWADTLQTRKMIEANKGKPERSITTGTYERAQKRLQKDVNAWFGRGMKS